MRTTRVFVGAANALLAGRGDYIEFHEMSGKVQRYRVLAVNSTTTVTCRKERRWRWLERVTVYFEDMRVTVRS